MNITIDWVNPKELIPHEDVIMDLVQYNIHKIRNEKRISPIIVDKSRLIILDGHHRYHAFLKLGIKDMPAILVDYNSELISIENWYVNIFPIPEISLTSEKDGNYCIRFINKNILCSDSMYKLYWTEYRLEQKLTSLGFTVSKSKDIGLYSLPPIPKSVVISISERGLVFPPKSTRHVYKFYIPREEVSLK